MNRCVIQKKSFNAYASRIESHPLKMLYDINPLDFAHHVRHANSWSDLGIRCGLEPDRFGSVHQKCKLKMLQQKVHNMRLNTEHFFGQQPLIPDDDFKTIVKESKSVNQVMMK